MNSRRLLAVIAAAAVVLAACSSSTTVGVAADAVAADGGVVPIPQPTQLANSEPDTQPEITAAPTPASAALADGDEPAAEPDEPEEPTASVLVIVGEIPAGTPIDDVLESPAAYLASRDLPVRFIADEAIATVTDLREYAGSYTTVALAPGDHLLRDQLTSTVPSVNVLVITADLDKGTPVEQLLSSPASYLAIRSIPAHFQAETAITSFDELVALDGMETATPMFAGEQVLSDRFVSVPARPADTSTRVPVPMGHHSLVLTVAERDLVAWGISPGDVVFLQPAVENEGGVPLDLVPPTVTILSTDLVGTEVLVTVAVHRLEFEAFLAVVEVDDRFTLTPES